MRFKRSISILILLIFLSFFGYGQSIDSLINLEFEELYQKKDILKKDKNRIFADAYLQKAKNLDSISEMARGYHWISYLVGDDYEKQIIYIDSGLAKVKNTEHVLQTGAMCNTKAIITQLRGDYNRALEYYLEGLENSEKMNSLYYKSVFNSKIGHIKRKLGKYEEAKVLYKKCLQYENLKTNKRLIDSLRYLMSLADLTTIYRLSKEIDSAHYFYNQGKKMSQITDIKGVYTLNKGILEYCNNDYNSAILTIREGIKEFLSCNYNLTYGYHNLMSGYFFLGKSYIALNQKEKAIGYFKKMDSFVNLSNDLISEARPAYPELIKYYKSINDKDNQLHYINRLLYNDSIFHGRYKSTTDKLNNEFDTPILLEEKEELIASLEQENSKISIQNVIILILLGLSLFGIAYYYYRQRLYKTRFTKLLQETTITDQKEEIVTAANSSGITKETFDHLIDQLQRFEDQKGYLKSNLNAKDLAKSFGSNSSYLSKVINTFKEKSFSAYINDLRIEYVIDKLKTDSIFRKYTIKAIAQDIGFNNAEAFSKAFYKKTGIYPSYFIKELEKQCL